MAQTFTIGKSVPRVDGIEKVTGKARFVYDLRLEGMLHGKTLRSPHPHAKIRKLEIGRAASLEGVKAVMTARDLPDVLHGDMIIDTPTFARDRVIYVGEPIAAVAAETPELAEEAIDLIQVEYETLPALLDPEEALKENPPLILHPDLPKYHRTTSVLRLDKPRPNVTSYWKVRVGDVESAFRSCDRIVENRYSTGMAHTWHTEPNVTVARPETDGTITVWNSAQNIHKIRDEIAEALELDKARIRVIVPPHVGGGFGNKSAVNHLEAICVALAVRTSRPVKIAFTREEVFVASTVRHPTLFHIKDGVNRDGRILARKITALYDGGAYAFHGDYTPRNAVLAASTVYSIPNLWIDSYRVCTNKPSGGAFRGNGGPQAFWAIESQMDEIASSLGLDAREVRLTNLLKDGAINGLGERVRDFHLKRCLEDMLRSLDASPPPKTVGPWKVGRGFALGHKWSGSNSPNTAFVKLRGDGRIDLLTCAIELGEGTQTALAQIVAEPLRIPPDRVIVRQADTAESPASVGAGGSRQLFNLGNAVRIAAQNLAQRISEAAALLLDAKLESVELTDGSVNVKGEPSRSMDLRELAAQVGEIEAKGEFILRHGKLDVEKGRYTEERGTAYYAGTAIGADVAVNPETGHVKILRIVCSADVGRAINPSIVTGQLEGGIAMGLGTALFEEMILEEGRLINADLKDYKLPTAMDMPRMESLLIESPLEDGPFGAKGVGETSIMVAAPAITNAITNAVGVRVSRLPMVPQDLLRLLRQPTSHPTLPKEEPAPAL